jgi:hypothetical protein
MPDNINKTSIVKRNVTPVRVLVSPAEHEKIKKYSETRGLSVSKEIRDALHDVAYKDYSDFAGIENQLLASNPNIFLVRGTKHKSIVIYLMESDFIILKRIADRFGNYIKSEGKSVVLRLMINSIISKYESSLDGKSKTSNFKGKVQKNNFTFKVRPFFSQRVSTIELISDLAKKRQISISELYQHALMNFSGSVIPEPTSVATTQVIVRLTAEDKMLIEKRKGKYTCDTVSIFKTEIYTDEDKQQILQRMVKFKCSLADVLRSAIYEELSRSVHSLED